MTEISRADVVRLKGIAERKPLIGPRSINIHITNSCDRRCDFCWYYSPLVSRRDRPRKLSYDVLERLLHDCAEMGVEEINLEGGEITLYPRIAEVFRLVPRLGMRLIAYTHLAYGREHLEYLWNADRLTVNLSAATSRSYQRVHGNDHFKDVLSNLKLLHEIRKAKGKPSLVATFIIHKDNYKELPGFLRIVEGIPVDYVRFRLFKATVEMRRLTFSAPSANNLRKIVEKELSKGLKISNNLSEIYRVLENGSWFKNCESLGWSDRHNDRLFYYNNLGKDNQRCYAGWFFAYIDERGRVVAPCDNVGVCVAGNINKESFKDIWFHSEKFSKIRQEAFQGINTATKRWFECRYCGHAVFNRQIKDVLTQKNLSESQHGA